MNIFCVKLLLGQLQLFWFPFLYFLAELVAG